MPSGRPDDRKPRRGSERNGRRSGSSASARRRPRADGADSGAARGPGRRSGGQTSARPQAGTGGAFKLSSTPRAAVLAILVCAMALSVSVPLRTYLSQREELAMRHRQQVELKREVQALERRKERLSDPQRVEAEARKRLGYVHPGETPYVVHLPPKKRPEPDEPAPKPTEIPWYQQLWKSLTGRG